ncbi:GtrA family protein [Nanoarchaeota archaeon]
MLAKKILFHKFSKFFYGGVLSYLIKVGLTSFLTEIFNIYYFYAYIFSLIFAIIFNFYFAIQVIFKTTKNKRRTFVKYLVSLGIIAVIDALLVRIITEYLAIHYALSITIITALIFVSKYFIYDKLVFTK